MVVKAELEKLEISHGSVELGEVNLTENIPPDKLELLRAALLRSGLELMNDKKSVLIQKIKNVIVELIHYSKEPLTVNFQLF